MKSYIYCVFDENENPIYIGKTIDKSLKKRLSSHKKRFANNKISICELDCVDSDWKFWESYWINQFKNWGFNLLNINDGGGGPKLHSEETKRKISEAKRGKPGKSLSEYQKQILLNTNLGSKRSEETKRLMSEQRKGKIFSEDYRKKLSDAAKKKVFTPEHKANIGKTSLGRTKSDEVKNKISEKLKGIIRHPMSDETKEKIRNSLLNKNKQNGKASNKKH